jgi:hypothetical protein
MMVNRENCTLAGFVHWVRRQLLSARLYHPGFLPVVLHGFTTSLALAAVVVLLGVALATHQGWVAAWLAVTLVGYVAAMAGLLAVLEHNVRRSLQSRAEPMSGFDLARLLRIVLAIPLTQIAYAGVLLSALRVRQVEWRGAHYEIDGPWRVRLLEYRPYRAQTRPEEALNSI